MNNRQAAEVTPGIAFKWLAVILGMIVLITAMSVGGCAGLKAFSRAQIRANAHNAVAVTHIQIQQARQQAQINYAQIQATKAEALKRYYEAVGIRHAQDEISRTLTPLYIQHEAIRAEEAIASSGQNNTVIYVPAGQNGVPIVTQPPTHR